MTLTTGSEDSENDMWKEYVEIVDEYDTRLTERWKEDTAGALVFVSSHALVPCVHHNDDPGDRSFFHDCRILHPRKLPTIVPRHWWPDRVPPRTAIPAVCCFRKWHPSPTRTAPIIPSQRVCCLRKHIVAAELFA